VVHRYDEMAETVSEIPDETEALVELQRYYRKASVTFTATPTVLSPALGCMKAEQL